MKRSSKALTTSFGLTFIFLAMYILFDFTNIYTSNWKEFDAVVIDVKVEENPRELYKVGTVVDFRSECKIIVPSINETRIFDVIIPLKKYKGELIRVRIDPKYNLPVYIARNSNSKVMLILFIISICIGIMQLIHYKRYGYI